VSGIVAILNTDGAACDAARLQDLTQALAFRGPDGIGMTVSGEAGLGATLFRTTEESATEAQPLSLDGKVWIVADCRIDDRATLIAALRTAGRPARATAPDIELVLHAYLAWGTRSVERLLGDFAFAIWDGRHRTLFAARDHLGAKPFFYAHVGGLLVVSNTLGCIRQHPDVPSEVNDAAIGDFLLIGTSDYPAVTAFRHIQRLPAAHTLRCSDGDVRVERYWQVSEYEEPLRLPHAEIVERFRELLRKAVSDRLRGRAAAVQLSGGVDSTSVAATVFDLQQRHAIDVSMTAWTFDWRPLVPGDREGDFARLTTTALGFPHVHRSYEGYTLFHDGAGRCVLPRQEPQDLTLAAADLDFAGAIAKSCRVLLTGQGGDAVFRGQMPRMRELLPHGWFTVAREAVSYALRRRTPPPLGIRTAMKRLAGITQCRVPPFPEWIEPAFADRQCLEDRWHDVWGPSQHAARNVVRTSATEQLRCSWASILERYDAEYVGTPLDFRHPLFDLRLVDFLLQVPAIPWFWHKDLPRRACLGSVPAEIRNRRKAPLAGDPVRNALERGDRLPAAWQSHPSLRRYVRCEQIPRMLKSVSPIDPFHQWSATYPVSLSLWLQSLEGEQSDEEVTRSAAGAWQT
jgi:asparagine synthase (glutamine-hydrolysing)